MFAQFRAIFAFSVGHMNMPMYLQIENVGGSEDKWEEINWGVRQGATVSWAAECTHKVSWRVQPAENSDNMKTTVGDRIASGMYQCNKTNLPLTSKASYLYYL